MRHRHGILPALVLVLAAARIAAAGPLRIELVSVSSSGIRGDYYSDNPSVSANGRYIAFTSRATTLVSSPPVTSGTPSQIYLRDRQLGTTELISIGTDGQPANGNCDRAQVSADGRYIAFTCYASNLIAPPAVNAQTIYVRDRTAGNTYEALRAVIGVPAYNYSVNGSPHYMSADAARFAFDFNTGSGSGLPFGIYILNEVTPTFAEVCTDAAQTDGNDYCAFGGISRDGGTVAFTSTDPGLVPGDTNGYRDAFAYAIGAATIDRVSVNANGSQANGNVGLPSSDWPALSGDGSLVAFNSNAATDLGGALPQSMLLVKNRTTGAILVASANDDGTPGDPSSPYLPAFDDAGDLLAFQSNSAALAPRLHPTSGLPDIFLRDLAHDRLLRICRSDSGSFANNQCQHPAVSGDGSAIAFQSSATNLVTGAVSGQGDIYMVTNIAFDDIFADGFEP